jgi:ABC-2 type transport system permease protein
MHAASTAQATLRRTQAVAARVLRQLVSDRRFLVLSLVVPVLIIYALKIVFDSLESPSPFFNISRFVLPLGAFIVHFITYILCAIVLVRERTSQTLARAFINGYRRFDIVSGYIAAYTLLATVQSLLVLGGLSVLFKLDYGWDRLLVLYLVIWLLAVISIALGILISNFARTEGQVFPFIPLVTLPSVFFSGVIIPVERLPTWAAPLELLTPLYYANAIIQTLVRPSGSLADDPAPLVGLIIYGLAILSLATLTLRETD